MLDVRLIHYFLVVAREQNMTRAAAELHISQPSLSAQISELESRIGVKLFRRTNKNTLLTEDGILFRSRAQELLDLSDKIESEFTVGAGGVSGDIFLGCAETHIMSYISEVFRQMKLEYPDVRLHIYSGDAEAVRERLDKGLLDVGLLLGPAVHEKYDYIGLGMYDTFGLLVPRDCDLAERASISVGELSELPILMSRQTASGSQNIIGMNPAEIHTVGSYNLATNVTYMVEQGLGYALCIDNLVNTEGRNLRFIPIKPEVRLEAYIVTKKYAYLSKAVRVFLQRLNTAE
ncbi:MAG: LysR family transcriptional regulator [Clostridia bacterium]|nr:LysR family transcriptional regulator [Clostridia bacterium]